MEEGLEEDVEEEASAKAVEEATVEEEEDTVSLNTKSVSGFANLFVSSWRRRRLRRWA